jgi:LysM repeat protein
MQFRKWWVWILIAALGLGLMPLSVGAAPAAQAGPNLLTDPGFEQPFVQANPTALMAPGWTPWWIPRAADQPDWSYHEPNYDQSSNCSSTCDHRIHSGGNAQRMYQFFGSYVAGVYQQVSVPLGADLQFTLFGQGWSSEADSPENVSINGTDMQMRIGIDPLGGTNPLDPHVVWSKQVNALDSWYQFTVYARSQNTTVTVFAYAAPFDARRKNEVYWDDAALNVVSGDLAATAQASYPTPTPTPVIYTPTPVSVAVGTNLLTNGGFEGQLYIPCSRADDLPWHHIACEGLDLKQKVNGKKVYVRWDTVQVPVGWVAWWYPPNTNHADPNFYKDHPNNCYSDAPESCAAWHNPEYRDTKGIAVGPSRIHSGTNSQKYFTFWSVHEAGLMQTVTGLTPGTELRFDVYMEAWSATEDGQGHEPSPYQSSGQTSMHMKVGIDPFGGDDPWSSNIIWSPEHDSYDNFGYYEVRAVAQSDKVTVFTHSMPEKAMKHNDMYVDDAELVAISVPDQPASAQSAPPSVSSSGPSAVVASAPQPTDAPRPDGSIVHTVQAGDTLFGLSLQYNVPLDQILQLNGLTRDSFIIIGQQIVISTPPPTTATPAAADSSAATPTPAQIAAADTRTQLCVRAFNDVNGDGVYAPGEALVSGTQFIVFDNQGQQLVTYSSDGVSEPHCFTRLSPGNYSVTIQPSPGTVATSDRRWSVVLDSGTTVDVNFGSRPGAGGATKPTSGNTVSDGAGTLVLVVLAFVLGAAGWSIYQRRKLSA